MLTVKDLQEKRLNLERDINQLLDEFTKETGYSLESIDIERRVSQGYYYGIYIYLNHFAKVCVDISTQYKHRKGILVKADTWIDKVE